MPFIEETPGMDAGVRTPQLRTPPPTLDPSLGSIAGAALRRENTLVSAYNYMTERSGFTHDPDHNPMDVIRGTNYEANHLDRFVDSRSAADTHARMRRIDREDEDRRILDAGGFAGFVAQVGAGVLDPTILIPAGTIYRGVRTGRAALQTALSTGAASAAMMAGQEAVLYGTQETRTGLESTMNIASGAIVGGLLGGAISALSRRQLTELNEVMDGFRREVNAEMVGRERMSGSAAEEFARTHGIHASAGADAGAASARREGLTLAGALGAQRAAAQLSPVTRLQTSPLETSRATVRDLGDAGLAYRENFDGVPTSEGGTVEIRVKMHRGPLIQAISEMDDAYARYFFGQQTPTSFAQRQTAGARAGWASLTGNLGGRMTAREFRDEVGRAMRRKDEHPIPEVAEAAQAYRKHVFEPLKKRAIELGHLPEDVKVLGADSYLTRVFNRERIIAQRDAWTGILTRHFTDLKSKASEKFEAKRSQKVSALERELSDLTTPAEARPALQQQLAADLDRLKAENPAFVVLDDHLKRLRASEAAAVKTGDKEAAKAIREELKGARESAGPDYARFVAERNQLAARQQRLERTAPPDPAAAGTRPETIKAFKEQETAELAELRKSLDETLDILASARDRELDQLKSIYNQKTAGAKKSERTKLQAQRKEGDARIALEHDRAVRRAEREFAPMLRQFKKIKAAERKTLLEGMDAGARSANRVADIQETIGRVKAQKGNELVEMLPEELPSLVDDVTDTILGESVFRLPGMALVQGPRGPLRKRILNVPDEAIEEFLESDVEKIARIYTQSMASDIELSAKFGDVQMRDVLTRLREEKNAKVAAATSDKQRTSIDKQFRDDVRDIGALRDRIRGNYRQPLDPDAIAYRAGKMALNLNYMARLGGVAISQIPDFARPIMRYGMAAFRDGWIPLINNFNNVKLATRELRLAGTALDMVRDQRALELADVLDDFGRNSKIERGVQAAADRFSMVNLMSPMNGASKSITGVIAMAEMIRATKAIATGKPTKKQIANLASGGVDEVMARRIWAHVEASGDKAGSVHLPNTEDWRLPNGAPDTKAIEAFRAVLNREVETAIVTPGIEKPLWTSYMLGRIMGQFKTFNLVSTQRVTLAGLQQRDAAALSGVLTAMALGATAAWIKAQLRGEDTTKWKTGQWVAEALDNSGIMGILSEVNAVSEKVTGGRLGMATLSGKTVSRYASRNVLGSVAGPTFDAVGDVATLGRLGSENWSRADTRAIRKVLPLSNLFYLRKLFDAAEEGINDSLNLPARRPRN